MRLIIDNRMLRRIFGLKVVKSRRMRWAGHVARVGEMPTNFNSENLRRRSDHWGDMSRS